MFKKKSFWFSLFLAALLFYWIFHNLDFSLLGKSLAGWNPWWFLGALAVYLCGWFLRVYRWQVLLMPLRKCTYRSLFPVLFIGFAANNLMPARIGELLRAHFNGKKEGLPRAASLATIFLERLFDGLAMLIILAAALSFLPAHGFQSEASAHRLSVLFQVSAWLFGGAFFLLLLLLFFRKQAQTTASRGLRFLPTRAQKPAQYLFHTFLEGLAFIQNSREVLWVLFLSLVIWSIEGTSFFLLAFGSDALVSLNLWHFFLLMAVVNLAIMVPSSPGGIGLFEATGVWTLMNFGIAKESAAVYLFLAHFLVLAPVTLIGWLSLIREGETFASLGKKELFS